MVAVTVVAAAPVFVVATERLWLAGGADAAAAQVVDGRAVPPAGIDVQVEAALDAGTIAAVDAELRRELDEIDGLAEPAAAIYTLPGITAARSGSDLVRFQARALAVDGARNAVTVRDQVDSARPGVWISSWLAERFEIGLGDELLLESGVTADEAFNDLVPGGGAAAGWPVTGIYEPIWNEDGSQPGGFWSTVPAEAVPRYLRPFRAPSFALLLVDRSELASSGLTGILRWTAPAEELPDRLVDLRERRSQYRRFESALVQGSPLADAMVEVSTPARRRPLLQTTLFDIVAEAERASGRLGGPIRVARNLGLVVGFAVTASVGSFIVRRRANEFALLAGEGERWPTMALRVLAQALPLFVGGAVLGTTVAMLAGRYLSASGWIAVSDLGWRSIVGAAAVGLGSCAVVAGAVGQQTLAVDGIDRRWIRALTAGVVIGLVALTAIFWVLAGGGDAEGGADLVVAGLPLAGLGLTAVAVTAGVGWLARRGRRVARRLGVVSLLAASRVAVPSPGLRMAVIGLAIGSGMVVYSTSLVTTVDRALDVKLATEVGAPTRLELFGDLPDDLDLPPRTTLLYTQDTVVTPGDRRVRVLAVDEATFAAAVQWPEEYGATAEEVVESISTGSRDTIPAVVITGEGLPGSGAIGTTQALPYRTVGRIEALPLARQFGATMVVSADRLDRFVADRNAELVAAGQDLGDNTRLPTSRFRRRVLSQLPLDVLEPAVVAEGVSVREGLSADVLARDPGRAATRLAFDYVAVVGIVALVAGAVSVALYSSGRARDQAVTTVMLATIGVPARRRGMASLAEVLTVVGIGAITAVGAAPILAARVARRFDPAPGVPPEVGVVIPVAVAVVLFVAVLVATTAIVLVPEGASARRSSAEVMRHAG